MHLSVVYAPLWHTLGRCCHEFYDCVLPVCVIVLLSGHFLDRRLIKLFADWNGKQAVGLHCTSIIMWLPLVCIIKHGAVPLLGFIYKQQTTWLCQGGAYTIDSINKHNVSWAWPMMLVCYLQAIGVWTSGRRLFIEKKSAPFDDLVLDIIVTLCAHVQTRLAISLSMCQLVQKV